MSAFIRSPWAGSVNDPTHNENILSVRGKTHEPNDESHQNNICRCKSKRVEPWNILPQSIPISQIKTLNQDRESGNWIIVNHIKSNQDKSNQIRSSNPKIKSKMPHSVKSKGQNVKCQSFFKTSFLSLILCLPQNCYILLLLKITLVKSLMSISLLLSKLLIANNVPMRQWVCVAMIAIVSKILS